MNLWKLGCRWGSNTPFFYDFIKDNDIVIGWYDKVYKKNEWLLIADGHSILAFAKVLENPISCLKYPHFQTKFEELKIPYENDLLIAKAQWIELKKEDIFKYKLQQGIVRVKSSETKKQFNRLLSKYMAKIDIESKIDVLEYKKQIILQGPPGTGKTRMAKEIASQLNAERVEIIQFHPSYTYEDFVRGITVKNEGDTIVYKTENKTLAKIAERAYSNYRNHLKDDNTLVKELQLEKHFDVFKDHILDEIEKKEGFLPLTDNIGLINLDTGAFRYKGKSDGWVRNGNRMLFKDILQAYSDGNTERQDLKNNPNLSGLAFQHASYFVRVLNLFQNYIRDNDLNLDTSIREKEPLKKYVLIIDEINRANLSSVLGELIYALEYRGEPVESIYEKEGEGNTLTLSPNLYIIGTMNTADRSVGQIDYAIRRRFAFVDVLPKVLTEEELNKDIKEGEPLLYFDTECFEKVKALFVNENGANSEYLSDEFNPKDVQLGHSYFIYSDDNFKYKLAYEIKPILREYVTDGILKDSGDKKIIEVINSL